MKLIAHRGNISGKSVDENKPDYIEHAVGLGYDVEIDVWDIDDTLWLGHDEPTYKTNESFLTSLIGNLWIHCKNLEALARLKNGYHCFFHVDDDAVLTSHNYIWTFPNKKLMKNSIAVMPEIANYSKNELALCAGICSDFIENYLMYTNKRQ